MSGVQFGITIAACTAATMLTRFLPFLIFSSKDQQPPEVVRYLGRVLPAAIFGMLIIYCLKGVSVFTGRPRHPGGHRHRRDHRAPQVEARNTGIHCRRYALLCAAGAACILTFVPQKGHGAAVSFLLPTDQ